MPGPGELFMGAIIVVVALWGGKLNTIGDLLGALFSRSPKQDPNEPPAP